MLYYNLLYLADCYYYFDSVGKSPPLSDQYTDEMDSSLYPQAVHRPTGSA